MFMIYDNDKLSQKFVVYGFRHFSRPNQNWELFVL